MHLTKKGFTLIEIAIVLVVVALAVGGIIAAMSMIGAANNQSFVRQVAQYNVAFEQFQVKYASMPGDSDKLTPPGDNDGKVESNGATDEGTAFTGEVANFWAHVSSVGGMPSKKTYTATITGTLVPDSAGGTPNVPAPILESEPGSGMIATYDNGDLADIEMTNSYIVGKIDNNDGTDISFANIEDAFEPSIVLAFDQKIDDGVATTGAVRAWTRQAEEEDCFDDGDTTKYANDISKASCSIAIQYSGIKLEADEVGACPDPGNCDDCESWNGSTCQCDEPDDTCPGGQTYNLTTCGCIADCENPDPGWCGTLGGGWDCDAETCDGHATADAWCEDNNSAGYTYNGTACEAPDGCPNNAGELAECAEQGGEWNTTSCLCDCTDGDWNSTDWNCDNTTCEHQTMNDTYCSNSGGSFDAGCNCNCPANSSWQSVGMEMACVCANGMAMNGSTCECTDPMRTWNGSECGCIESGASCQSSGGTWDYNSCACGNCPQYSSVSGVQCDCDSGYQWNVSGYCEVISYVCGSGQCDPGEDQTNCPEDCGCAQGSFNPMSGSCEWCGDMACNNGETSGNFGTCPQDCGCDPDYVFDSGTCQASAYCGDGFCNNAESGGNGGSCPEDCGCDPSYQWNNGACEIVCDPGLQSACEAEPTPGSWQSWDCSCMCPADAGFNPGTNSCECGNGALQDAACSGQGGTWYYTNCYCQCPDGLNWNGGAMECQ